MVWALKSASGVAPGFNDLTIHVMLGPSDAAGGVEAMSPRGALGFLVLAVLVAPLASAQAPDALGLVEDAAAQLGLELPAPVVETFREPEPAVGTDPVPVPGTRYERESESEEAARERPAPRGEQSPPPSPLSPVGAPRLVPVPMVGQGAVPKVDLSVVDQGAGLLRPLIPAASAPAKAAPAPRAAPPAEAETFAVVAEASPVLPAGALVAVAAAASAAAPAFGWERLRRLAFLAALYSRIARENLLDHGSRERLLDAIRDRPGLAVADLAKATSTPRNTVTYHLRVLEREGLVTSKRNGRNRLFFAPGAAERRMSDEAIAALRHETSRAMAVEIGATPGLDQQALCQKFGLQPSLAHWHADRLVASGIAEKRREGRRVRYYPGASFSLVAGFIAAPAPRETPPFTTSA